MAGETARALRFWARFREGLAGRWQGDGQPDPLGWFLAATSITVDIAGGGRGAVIFDWCPDAGEMLAMPLPSETVQRQDRVV